MEGLSAFHSEKLWIRWLDVDNKKIPIPEIGGEYHTFDALPPLREGSKGGVGLVLESLSDGRQFAGVDLDGCLGEQGLAPWAQEIVEALASYTEISPSGTGVKIFFLLDENSKGKVKLYRKQVQWPKHSSQKKSWGIEFYLTGGRFFTVTGRVFQAHDRVTVPTIKTLKWVNDKMKDFDSASKAQKNVLKAVAFMPNDEMPWEDWNTRGMAIYNATMGSPAGQEAWIDYSRKSHKFDMKETLDRWEHWKSSPGDYVSAKDVINWGKEGGYEPEDDIADEYGCREQVLALNERWAHILLGKTYFILDNRVREHTLYSLINTKSWREGELGFSPTYGKKEMPLHDIWLESRYRLKYNGIVLAPPGADPYPDTMYNIWKGLAIDAKKPTVVGMNPGQRGWELFKRHLFHIICKDNQENWKYLWRWMAHKFQMPGKKIGVAIVLKGGKGAGKTIVADYLRKIFGAHFVRVSHEEHLLGKFNAHLEHALIVNAEEAFWAKSRKAENILKDLITGDTLQVERKGVDSYTGRNLMDILITSNSDWVVPASADERRYYVLEVSDEVVGNYAYFKDLAEEMEGNGPSAMLYDLLSQDITEFEPRNVPQTEALWEQKLISSDPHERFIISMAVNGRVPHMGENFVVEKSKLYERYRDYVANNKGKNEIIDAIFFKHLAKLGVWGTRPRIDGEQKPCANFPSLKEFRANITKHYSHEIEWNELEEWFVVVQGQGGERRNLDFEK